MKTFNDIWTLLAPKVEYEQLKGKCRILWESFSPDKQDYIYSRIEEKKKRKEFVDYNPKFAIEKNSSAPRQQTMSYADYYSLYGTTEERDGWKMFRTWCAMRMISGCRRNGMRLKSGTKLWWMTTLWRGTRGFRRVKHGGRW